MDHATARSNSAPWQRRDQRHGAPVRAQADHCQSEAGKEAVGSYLLGGVALTIKKPMRECKSGS